LPEGNLHRPAAAGPRAGEGFAAATAIAIQAVEVALAKRPESGAHTPATVFGSEFIDSVPGSQVIFKNLKQGE